MSLVLPNTSAGNADVRYSLPFTREKRVGSKFLVLEPPLLPRPDSTKLKGMGHTQASRMLKSYNSLFKVNWGSFDFRNCIGKLC